MEGGCCKDAGGDRVTGEGVEDNVPGDQSADGSDRGNGGGG